jgi:hypothetical protein
MGLGGILFIVAVLISLITFIILMVKTAREMGAFHLVMASILFIECWVFMFFVAGVQNVRVAATKDAKKETEKLVKVSADLEKIVYGTPNDPEESLDSVVRVQGKLDRLTIDRGRVWRQVSFVKHSKVQDKDQVQLNLQSAQVAQPADPNNPAVPAAPAVPAGRSLPLELLVYGFHEQTNADGQPLPVYYLGEYKVVNVDEASGSVTIESTQPGLPLHQQRIAAGTESWTLYELLPIDSHTAFAKPGSSPSTEEVFGHPDDETINQLLASVPESVRRSYLRDGTQKADDDPVDSIWALLDLQKELKSDVDSDQNADATVSSYFDNIGRSIDVRLRRGEEVTLDPSALKDNLVVVIGSEGTKLVSSGIAQEVKRLYVRPLNDYEQLFNTYAARGFELDTRIEYTRHVSKLIDQSSNDLQGMVAGGLKEKQDLGKDLSNYKKEVEILTSAVAAATSEYEQLKQDLSRLYQEIQGRRDRLVSASKD